MDCSPPGSSVRGILQARLLEWVAMPSSRGPSWPRDQTCASCVSCIAGRFFSTEPLEKPWRLLRVPWTARRSNQSILKEINPGISLEGMMLKLKLQYFGHLMRRVDSLEKTLMLGGIGGRRRRGWQKMRWLDGIMTRWTWVWMNSGSWWWTGRPDVLQFMGSQRVGHNWATELNWTDDNFV